MVSIASFCLGVILLPAVICTQSLQQQTCSSVNSVTIQDGSTAYLGGILTISQSGDEGYGCVPPYIHIPAIEAMRWALDLLNKINETISTEYVTDYYVPGITLGMKLFDNCYRSAQAVASLGKIYPELLARDSECTKQDEMMFGIVGPSSSGDSMETSVVAQPYHIPLISFQSTVPELTTSNQYPNFMRTIVPDDRLMEVIVKVLDYLEWKYLVIIYENSGYGRSAFEEFHGRYVAAGCCLTAAIPYDVHNLEDGYVDSILSSALSTEATGVLFFGHSDFAKALLERGEARMPNSGRLQWLMMNLAQDEQFDTQFYQRGIITISVGSRFIVEFEDHWFRLNPFDEHPEDPWFREWYETRNDCSVTPAPGQRDCADVYGTGLTEIEREKLLREDYMQDGNVEPAIMAVFTYANALRRAQMDKCATRGPCDALRSMSREEFLEDYLKTVDFTFTSVERVPSLASHTYEPYNAAKRLSYDDNGDIENPSFYIWNFNDIETGAGENNFRFRRVGTYINGNLDVNSNSIGMYDETRTARIQPFPKSHCPDSGCSPCIDLPVETVYYYEPGDVVINGLFSLHDMGSQPLSCGSLKSPNQVMFMEAMIYAIDSVNNDASLLPGIKLGGLGFDDCSSSALGQAFIGKVQQGLLKIDKDGNDVLDPLSIRAYTAAHTSPLTIPLAELMNSLEKPLVGYRAGNSELDNQEMYPYYVRAFPGIREEMWAIILLLKKFGWMHVQVVASNMQYSEDAEKVFRDLAAKEGICIVAKHMIGTTTDSADAAVRGLSVGSAEPTVALLDTHEHHLLLQALDRNPGTQSRIALIATSRWGTNEKLVEGLEEAADGVVTLSQRHSSLLSFQNYLSNLRYNSHDKNPWFNDWFAQVHNCSQATCSSAVEINAGSEFEVMYEIENVINAVRAIAHALHSMLNTVCGAGSTGLCNEFVTAVDTNQALMDELRRVQFPIEDMTAPNTFRFSGPYVEIGFNVYNFRSSNYELVGVVQPWNNVVNHNSILLRGGASPSDIITSCREPCLECLYMFNFQDYLYVPGDVLIGVIFNIHYSGDGPYTCGDIRVENGAIYSEIVKYAVNKINDGLGSASLGAPLKLGVLGFDGCSNPTRALAILNRVTTNLASIIPSVTESDIIAWITYDSEITQESALFLQKLGIPLVSPDATAPGLADTDLYNTLFRTAPIDAIIARGMADFVNNMGFSYVLIVNAPDTSSRESADLFTSYLRDYGICVVARYEFVTDGTMEVILGSLTGFETNVVAVFAEPDRYIKDFMEERPNFPEDLRFIANRRWISESDNREFLEASVFFEMSSPTVDDFYTYLQGRNVFSSSDNPWLGVMYEEIFSCNLPGSFYKNRECELPQSEIRTRQTNDIWTLPTIHAVTAITQALNRTLTEKCGSGYNSVCVEFMREEDMQLRLMHYLDDVNFRDVVDLVFEFINRQSNRGYLLHQYEYPGPPTQVGSLSVTGTQQWFNEQDLRDSFNDVDSSCSGECLVCQISDLSLKDYAFVNGRVYIIGLFDVHKKGPTPFSCGEINDEHGMQLLEAFNFALDYVNSGRGIFRNKLSAFTLGGFGLDTCQSPTRAANLVANIHSGNLELVGGGRVITTRQIEAYIGTMETESSIRVADILSQLQIPQVSYGATGMDLLDMEKYDYFLRSVPADDKQARAVISYLKKFEYNNIQLVNSFDEIGEPGAKEFERLADLNLVCITTKYTVGMPGNDTDEVIGRITGKFRAQVVVLWMKDPLPILEAAARNIVARSQILFIATDKWGAHPAFLQLASIRPLLEEENLVILDVETADFPEFDHYLESKTPGNYTRNPWFKEYYESHLSCVWDLPVRPGETACDRSASIPRALHYIQDPYVLYVINAVFSVALAIDGTLKEFCIDEDSGADYGICNLYRTSGERRQRVLRHLRQVRFTDNTHQPFFYTEDGQSDRGFHIYNVTKDPSDSNSFMYQNIGSYNDSNFLKLDIRYDTVFNAICDPDGTDQSLEHCTCPFEPDLPSRFMKKDNEGRGLTLAYIGDIHQADPNNKFACGPINTGVDLQRLLAFFFAIDRINSNADLNLPDSIRLDGVALDSCSNGLRLGQDVYNLLGGNPLCDSDEVGTIVAPSSIVGFVVDKNHNAIPVSSMLAEEGIITISPTASNGGLDDEFQHPYFIRTTGGNREQAKVILELVRNNQWDLLSVIYTDNADHRAAVEDLLMDSRRQGICVHQASSLSLDASSQEVRGVLNTVLQQNGIKAIALFVEPAHVRLIMETTRDLRLTGQYVWIFPATWDTHMADISGYEPELRGSILIQHRSGILDSFIDYMTQLTFTNRHGIPDDWFEEIYETIHKCNIFNRDMPSARRYSVICSESEEITRSMVMEDLSILHVILSVYSAAIGLTNIPVCSGDIDIAACLQLQDQKNLLIYRGILGINFRVFPNELGNSTFDLTYNLDGNGQAGYDIKYYTTTDNGLFVAKDLGYYTPQGLSTINWEEYREDAFGIDSSSTNTFISRCPLTTICTCQGPGEATWNYLSSGSTSKETCDREGEIINDPDTGKLTTLMKPGISDRFEDTWAIIVTALAGLGALVSFALFIYLLFMYPVRGGTSVLGYILTFGVILVYLMVLPFIAHADESMCALRKFGLGFVYALVYSALLVKLVDCWRVRGKNDSYSVKYSKLGRPFGLFFITLFLVLVQVMIDAEWLILEEPEVECIVYKGLLWPRCVPDDYYDEGLVLSLCYVMVLIVFSFFLGLITYTSLQNHREPRWILAIFALSIPCWVIWCVVAIRAEVKVRDAAVAVGLLVNATIILIFVPIRKLYLLRRYNALIEEEEKLAKEGDYNSTYGQQYDNTPRLHDTGSLRGSSVGPRTYTGSGVY